MLEIGIKGKREIRVVPENTALAMGSGTLKVFATPAMIGLMEETAWRSVTQYLEEGAGTVGTQINVSHLAATPLDMKIRCESQLIQIDGRRLVFEVAAYDERGLIGKGIHERFIVNDEKFQAKADDKNVK